MVGETVEVRLRIDPGSDADEGEMEVLTRRLLDELKNLDIDTVEVMVSESAPADAKSGDVFSWGSLILTLAASGGLLSTVVNAAQQWLSRTQGRSITLEIDGDRLEVQGISSEEQKRLVDTWLSRHAKG